jgi:hypothetical protein
MARPAAAGAGACGRAALLMTGLLLLLPYTAAAAPCCCSCSAWRRMRSAYYAAAGAGVCWRPGAAQGIALPVPATLAGGWVCDGDWEQGLHRLGPKQVCGHHSEMMRAATAWQGDEQGGIAWCVRGLGGCREQ